MDLFEIIFVTFLQLVYFKDAKANTLKDIYGNSEYFQDDKYVILLENNDDIYDKKDIGRQQNENNKGNYYLIFDKNLKPVQRRFIDLKKDREERKQAELLKSQQERKVREITEFMKDHPMTTNFLYDELNRIKRQRMVKDDLRRMVEYLEKPGKEAMRSNILKCYERARILESHQPRDIWGHETNNLVINVLKDPYNDGYIN